MTFEFIKQLGLVYSRGRWPMNLALVTTVTAYLLLLLLLLPFMVAAH